MKCEMALSNVIFMEGGVECRKIPEAPKYFAGSNGVIFSTMKGKLSPLKPYVGRSGYQQVNLFINGVGKTMPVHRLIAITFIPNPDELRVVNHRNGVKTDNFVSNLEWTSHQENTQHAVDTGLIDICKWSQEVRVIDIETGETETFMSEVQCAERFGCTSQNVHRAIKFGSILKKHYKAEFVSTEAQTTDRKESISKWRENTPVPVWIDGKMWLNGKECKLIPGSQDHYASPDGYIISNAGKIPIVKKPHLNQKTGYRQVRININGVYKSRTVHRIIAETYIPNPEGHEVVNHRNGQKTDNSVSNLEWASQSENMQHAVNTGLMKGSKAPKAIWVTDIRTGDTETFTSIASFARHLGCSQSNISDAIKLGFLVQHHYKIGFVGDEISAINNNETLYVKRCHPLSKMVRVTDIKTGETETFISTAQCAERIGCCQSNVSVAIKHGTIVQKRYKIEFADSNEKSSVGQCKMVRLTDIKTGETKTFMSRNECAEHLGCTPKNVGNAIHNKRLCMKRYMIEFVED